MPRRILMPAVNLSVMVSMVYGRQHVDTRTGFHHPHAGIGSADASHPGFFEGYPGDYV